MKNLLLALIMGVLFMNSAYAKSIVVYYSKTGEQYSVGYITKGNTAKVAEAIAANVADCELLELKTVKSYPDDYSSTVEEAKKEKNENARPQLKTVIPDLSSYDTVFIGCPNWWGDMPMCVYTFLEKVNLEGKTIKPFITHEGSGHSGIDSKIKRVQPKANVTSPLAIIGSVAQNDKDATDQAVKNWINK